MTNLPADQEIRDRALSAGESFHLEAPAGSGKTSVLLARFLTLLARVEAPEELLALTFTRKAAGELRSRVMQLFWRKTGPGPEAQPWERRLQDLADQVILHFDRKGLALQEILAPERLPVMTFHSFCAQLLKAAPHEAGVPLDFQLLEERDSLWLKQEALEELRRRLAARPSQDPVRLALVRRLVRLNNDWPRLAGELRSLLSRRDSLEEFLALAQVSQKPKAYEALLVEHFQMLLKSALEGLALEFAATQLGRNWPQFWQELQEQGAPLAATLPPQLPGDTPADLSRWQNIAQALLTKQGELRKSLTPSYGFPPDFKQTRWPALIQNLPQTVGRGLKFCRQLNLTAARPEEVAALQDLVILLGETLAVYEELCAHRGALDFIALELAALRLLKEEDPSDLLLRLDWRLKHLLVDEFQDTSANQMTLLCRLLEGWEAWGERTLMVVGDPKQSIYGWRQAKVRLFQEARQGLPCSPARSFPLKGLLLTTNFRASLTLIAWANKVFGETVMAAATPEGVGFHVADPRPGAPAGEIPYLALFTGDGDQAARQAEARWLAGQVAQALAHRQEKETIGILLFARTHLPVYLKALNDAGLPVKVREGLKLTDSRVAAHLHNLVRALVRPADEVAWAAVLRGPWATQSLGTLARVAQTPGEGWPEKLRHFAEEHRCPADLAPIIAALLAAREQVGRRPLTDILGRWLADTGSWSGLAAAEGPLGVANARAYLDLLAEAEAALPEATFLKADFMLKDAFQPPDPRALESPVEVLTVHGAKGLEFDVVFVPYLDWQPLKNEDRTPPFLLEEVPGKQHALALARPYLEEKQSSLYLLLRNLKDQRILAEARRVFYVAVTRARQRLVLSGVIKQNKQWEEAPPAESPLGWLWQHYAPAPLAPGSSQTWPEPELGAGLFTDAEVPATRAEESQPRELPEPWEFQPEAEPYRLQFPSQLATEAPEAGYFTGTAEAAETPRLRGEVIHALLDTLSQEQELPAPASVAAALRQGGLAPAAAHRLAPEILAEVEACLQDPLLARLLAPNLPVALSEWLIEDQPARGVVRRGKLDRLAFDGEHWWLLDYKTSRPPEGESWEDFIAQETEKYRPQLEAYREMAARAKGLAPEAIRVALYFTAIRKVVEL
ncbi:MAG: UvrD-helicase domain-containing protein [Desulfobaccales bacterium]|nr:UvrD-helicase domain-containing protein [Desulfobaccales bacterium]